MSNDNTPKTQSQVTVSPTAEGESPASPETSKRRWALRRKKNSYASSLRPITQEEIDSLPAALSSQQKVEKAAAEQARLAVASTKPKPWVEVLYLLLGKNGKSDAPAEKPSIRDFSNRDFRGFALYGKDLSKTNFTNANFRGVDLTEADLNGSDLRNAQLQHSILEDAVLTDVKNLTLRQVGGANLQNIQPPTAVTIDASAQVDKALENAGKLYLTTISLCIFSVLVVLATTDIEIVAGTGKTTLPLVNLQIPTGWFFFITPLLITITHLTLHLHLLRAWEAMLDLPAIYPDGRTVDRKVNPLLLNSIVLLHWPRLRGELPPFTFTQAQLSKLTLYWAAPIALFMFWGRYLVKQSTGIVVWHLVLLFLTILSGRILRLLWFCSLRARSQWETLYSDWKAWPGHLVALAVPLLLFGAYYTAMYSPSFEAMLKEWKEDEAEEIRSSRPAIPKSPWLYSVPLLNIQPALFLHQRVSANLSSLQIPTKPADWIEERPEGDPPESNAPSTKDKVEQKRRKEWSDYLKQFESITQPARFGPISLRYARLNNAFLVKADLSGANLSGANLSRADLYEAYLNRALLSNADLTYARLSRADLIGADLSNANLVGANLSNASLDGANLSNAYLKGADLSSASLDGANLRGALYTTKDEHPTRWPKGFNPITHGAKAVVVWTVR